MRRKEENPGAWPGSVSVSARLASAPANQSPHERTAGIFKDTGSLWPIKRAMPQSCGGCELSSSSC